MARVNIETRALAETRFFDFIQEMSFDRPMAIGVLTIFWHDSQELRIVNGTKEQLLRCIPLKNDDRERALKALIFCNYVSDNKDGTFEIHGNQKHIDAILVKKESAKKGGIASGKTRRKSTTSKQNEANASTSEHNAMQSNAKQANAIQSNTVQSKKERKNTKSPEGLSASAPTVDLKSTPLWLTYCEEYTTKWKKEPPPRNGTVNSQLCNLIKHFGPEKAIDVIRHYFKMPDPYYHKNFHPIGLLVKQAHQIYSSMTTGRTMTQGILRSMDNAATLQETFKAIDRGEV